MEQKKTATPERLTADSIPWANIAQPTQISKIKAHLESGWSITPFQALCTYGCFRLASVVFTLRRRGLNIETCMERNPRNGSRYARYILKEIETKK